jgi:ABC-type transporter Mla MlaB component
MDSESSGASLDPLVCQREDTPEGLCFHLRGDLARAGIPILWSNLKAALEDGNHVIVDLGEVETIDQSGITALDELHRLFIDAGQRFVVVATPSIARNLSYTQGPGLQMKVFTSTEAARHSFLSDIPCA